MTAAGRVVPEGADALRGCSDSSWSEGWDVWAPTEEVVGRADASVLWTVGVVGSGTAGFVWREVSSVVSGVGTVR